MNPVIYFCQIPVNIPAELLAFFVLKSLELFDKVQLEFYRNPGGKLKGNVLVGVSSPISSGFGY